ncbi:PAS domain S-box protein [Methylomicrobium sp. Wu6]|uniref:SpoIIE family protein phosphatase n=1 Tax=Methylomicrobium sp. Wu6 TaxID=3107928 RepID=UPI002DD65678|nr:PAS domain S-box protein [Methylomicrobium sp. Wu6]MEC4747340.1 PAS domain S-box protein [Methylomicrobium sp. Wu6]
MNEKNLLQAVLDTLNDGICLLDEEGRVQAVNAAALNILSYRENELVEYSVVDAFAADSLNASLERVFVSGQHCRDEKGIFKRKNGIAISVSYSLDPVRVGGNVGGAVLQFREMTSLPVCDVALRDSESKFGAILDTIIDGVIAIDESCIIQLFNPAAEILFGYRREEVLGFNVNLLMPSPDHDAHDGYIANYLRTDVKKIIGIGREVTGKRKDGTLFPLHLSIGEAVLGDRRLFVGIIHDLTSRKRAEEKLITLSRAVEQSPSAVMIANSDGMIEYVNTSFTILTGYTCEDILGKSPSLLRSPHTSPEQYRRLKETLLEGGEWREEIQDRKKSGELYWALETISPVRNGAGIITHFLAIQQDITEQKQNKEALLASEERFRKVAEMSGEWLWEQDLEGFYTYSSSAVRQILGYEPEEILGKSYLKLLTDEDKEYWTTELPSEPKVQKPFYHLVNRYRHKDGREIFTESTGKPLFGEDGRLIKWLGVDHDITARKLYEDALQLRDRAIEAASVGINIANAREKHNPNIYVNPALSRITGYTREELLGQSMRILQGPDTDKTAIEEISCALREGRSCEVVLKNYRKEGTPYWNELLISPVWDSADKLTHFIGVHSDVTERRRAEEERHELEIAKQIQLSLLPKAPLILEGIQVAGICLPATHVGGDYYDYFYSSDTLHIVIADVSGHSMGAALIIAGLRSTLKAETSKTDALLTHDGTAATLLALNELLYDDLNGADLFITMFYMRYNSNLRQLCYANAGHNCPLLLIENESSCQELDAEGMIIGIKKDVVFEEKCVQLKKGDKVLLYTDGVTEAQNPEGEFFGVARLCELFSSQSQASPEATINTILEALRSFCCGHSFDDDVTMVVLKVE